MSGCNALSGKWMWSKERESNNQALIMIASSVEGEANTRRSTEVVV